MKHVPLINTNWLNSRFYHDVGPALVGPLLNLLSTQWLNPTCSLPADPEVLAHLAGVESWEDCERLQAQFPPHPTMPDRVANPKLLDHYERNANKSVTYDECDMEVALWMWDLIHQMQPGRKKPDMKKWAFEIRHMRVLDQRTVGDIRSLFSLVNSHNFWRRVILSPDKLREKWDNLTLQLVVDNGRSGYPASSAARRVGQPARIEPTGPEKVAKTRLGGQTAAAGEQPVLFPDADQSS